jgi:hypothetical protein
MYNIIIEHLATPGYPNIHRMATVGGLQLFQLYGCTIFLRLNNPSTEMCRKKAKRTRNEASIFF